MPGLVPDLHESHARGANNVDRLDKPAMTKVRSGTSRSHRPGMTAWLELDPRPRRSLRHVFLRLLERTR